jgi:hypothetical protein
MSILPVVRWIGTLLRTFDILIKTMLPQGNSIHTGLSSAGRSMFAAPVMAMVCAGASGTVGLLVGFLIGSALAQAQETRSSADLPSSLAGRMCGGGVSCVYYISRRGTTLTP